MRPLPPRSTPSDSLVPFTTLFRSLLAALLVEHALRLGDDDLGSRFLRCRRLAQCVAHLFEVVGAVDRTDPAAADAAYRALARVLGRAFLVLGPRRKDILATGCCRSEERRVGEEWWGRVDYAGR